MLHNMMLYILCKVYMRDNMVEWSGLQRDVMGAGSASGAAASSGAAPSSGAAAASGPAASSGAAASSGDLAAPYVG